MSSRNLLKWLNSGVPQGCILGPTLFTLFAKYSMSQKVHNACIA